VITDLCRWPKGASNTREAAMWSLNRHAHGNDFGLDFVPGSADLIVEREVPHEVPTCPPAGIFG